MYIPKTKPELFDHLASLLMYADDLTAWEYVESVDQVERDFNQALDALFKTEPEEHARLKVAADAAFEECRKGDGMRAGDHFAVIIDALTPSIGFPKAG